MEAGMELRSGQRQRNRRNSQCRFASQYAADSSGGGNSRADSGTVRRNRLRQGGIGTAHVGILSGRRNFPRRRERLSERAPVRKLNRRRFLGYPGENLKEPRGQDHPDGGQT